MDEINSYEDEPSLIRIIGIIEEEIGTPKNDGTRGSALYKIPFKLSQIPSSLWCELFIKNWNHPPKYTYMHRPGIASIEGDEIILDGTTVDEVRDYHKETLVLATDVTNKEYKEIYDRQQEQKIRKQQELDQHKDNVKKNSDRIDFSS